MSEIAAQAGSVTVQVELSREEYARVKSQARKENRTAQEIIPALIEDGRQSRMTAREIMERVSEAYRARIAEGGQPELTAEELLAKLRRDREAIANEFYP